MMACSYGCGILYPASDLFLFGVYIDGSTEYMGYSRFDTVSYPPSSVRLYQDSSGHALRYPRACLNYGPNLIIAAEL